MKSEEKKNSWFDRLTMTIRWEFAATYLGCIPVRFVTLSLSKGDQCNPYLPIKLRIENCCEAQLFTLTKYPFKSVQSASSVFPVFNCRRQSNRIHHIIILRFMQFNSYIYIRSKSFTEFIKNHFRNIFCSGI